MTAKTKYIFSPNDKRTFEEYFTEKKKTQKTFFILTDNNTAKHCLDKLLSDFPVLKDHHHISINSGEKSKSLETCKKIWKILIEKNADRQSVLINLGGGMITDIGAFCASVFKRGINFCHVPTSLLAMVDASIGGKTAIDFMGYKNIIGTFSFPEITYIDNTFLHTLPRKQLNSGFAEMLKTALISDQNLWLELKKTNPDEIKNIITLIKKVALLKNVIVSKDPYEKNIRKTLNFGHTIGHAIESYSLLHHKKPMLHGEAVAAGMICESYISHKMAGLKKNQLVEICDTIYANFKNFSPHFEKKELMKLMLNDKKNKNQKINFTLLNDIGKAEIDCYPETSLIEQSIDFYLGVKS